MLVAVHVVRDPVVSHLPGEQGGPAVEVGKRASPDMLEELPPHGPQRTLRITQLVEVAGGGCRGQAHGRRGRIGESLELQIGLGHGSLSGISRAAQVQRERRLAAGSPQLDVQFSGRVPHALESGQAPTFGFKRIDGKDLVA